jgi:glutamate decarboxylase
MSLHRQSTDTDASLELRPQFARAATTSRLPTHRMPDDGMPPRTAAQVVSDELLLDGQARLNLATFVTTWMEPEATALLAASADKNIIDKDEYPRTAELERRCVNILADLWGASVTEGESATGCSTTGSSEACMLAGMALKWRWRKAREAAGLAAEKPNLVMGSNVQVCWEKFCRYWEIEPRLVPVSEQATHLTAEGALAHCDENTIGVVAILGSTFDGTYEPVAEICGALDDLQTRSGLDVPVHVDAASGGFVAPFLDPDLIWDFRLPRVQSINASGHKYGLVTPGVGWALWRDSSALPEELVFHVDYLGGDMPTFALNFSRPGAQVVVQYHQFLRLGRAGYAEVQQACRDTASWLADRIGELDAFTCVSHGRELPVLAFRATDPAALSVFDVSEALRSYGWIVPAYHMPAGLEEMAVLRIVVRNGFSRELAGVLVEHVTAVAERLDHRGGPSDADRTGFHH